MFSSWEEKLPSDFIVFNLYIYPYDILWQHSMKGWNLLLPISPKSPRWSQLNHKSVTKFQESEGPSVDQPLELKFHLEFSKVDWKRLIFFYLEPHFSGIRTKMDGNPYSLVTHPFPPLSDPHPFLFSFSFWYILLLFTSSKKSSHAWPNLLFFKPNIDSELKAMHSQVKEMDWDQKGYRVIVIWESVTVFRGAILQDVLICLPCFVKPYKFEKLIN